MTTTATEMTNEINLETLVIKDDEVDEKVENVAKKLEGCTIEQVVGKPVWSNPLRTVTFESLEKFEQALAQWEAVLQRNILQNDVNTFGSYTKFSQDFSLSNNADPVDFYRNYETLIMPDSLCCVGLSVCLLKSLRQQDQFGPYFALVPFEEFIPESPNSNVNYDIESQDILLRHFSVCLKFALGESGRTGYVLLDAGWAIAHPIVVMRDEAYPHTGWFTKSFIKIKTEKYHYQLVNDKFIRVQFYTIYQKTGEPKEPKIDLIYIGKECLVSLKSGFDVAMRYYIVRNRAGPVAIFFSFIDKKDLFIIYMQNGIPVKHHFSIDDLDKEEVHQALRMVAWAQCSDVDCSNDDNLSEVEEKAQKYLQTLKQFRKACDDKKLSSAMVQLNNWISDRKQHIDYSSIGVSK